MRNDRFTTPEGGDREQPKHAAVMATSPYDAPSDEPSAPRPLSVYVDESQRVAPAGDDYLGDLDAANPQQLAPALNRVASLVRRRRQRGPWPRRASLTAQQQPFAAMRAMSPASEDEKDEGAAAARRALAVEVEGLEGYLAERGRHGGRGASFNAVHQEIFLRVTATPSDIKARAADMARHVARFTAHTRVRRPAPAAAHRTALLQRIARVLVAQRNLPRACWPIQPSRDGGEAGGEKFRVSEARSRFRVDEVRLLPPSLSLPRLPTARPAASLCLYARRTRCDALPLARPPARPRAACRDVRGAHHILQVRPCGSHLSVSRRRAKGRRSGDHGHERGGGLQPPHVARRADGVVHDPRPLRHRHGCGAH